MEEKWQTCGNDVFILASEELTARFVPDDTNLIRYYCRILGAALSIKLLGQIRISLFCQLILGDKA